MTTSQWRKREDRAASWRPPIYWGGALYVLVVEGFAAWLVVASSKTALKSSRKLTQECSDLGF